MPGDDRFWFDNDQDIAPSGPHSAKENPKYPICHSQMRTRIFPLKNSQLLAKGNDLETEVVAGTEKGVETCEGS